MTRSLRIAIGGVFQETSQFLTTRTELDLWKNTYVHHGGDLLQLAGTDCENAGMLAVCQAEGAQAVPLLAARCVSGGPQHRQLLPGPSSSRSSPTCGKPLPWTASC